MKTEQFKPPSLLSLKGNTSENWKCWKQCFELYVKVPEADQKDKEIQVAVLLHFIGGGMILRHLLVTPLNLSRRRVRKNNIDAVLMKFDDYCM